jgi:hypothetical protein
LSSYELPSTYHCSGLFRVCVRMHSLDLDECIAKLKRRELLREEILEAICELVKEVLMRESNVVHVAAPITVVGDIHGYSLP